MKRDLRFILTSLLFVAVLAIGSFAQETTGILEITIKDTAGSVVPNVAVTVTGATGGFRRNGTTNDEGFLRLIQVPPGTYTVSAAATSGFAAKKIENLSVGLGRVTPVAIEVGTGDVSEIVEVAETTTGLDLAGTRGETTISAEVADLLPKGLNFSTVLKFAAAARPESRSGQFQIDGASASENVFIVDGQEVSDTLTGALDRNSNLPFSVIQETQIKNSGFEAEYGGATGGVINVVTKSGGNALHGEFGVMLRSSHLEPKPGPVLRFPNLVQFYPSRRDQYSEFNPTAAVNGPIWKNKVFFSVAYAPQIFKRNRTLAYRDAGQPNTLPLTGQSEHYFSETRNEKVFGRLDAQPFSKLNLYSTFQWNPEIQTGGIPGYTSELISVPSTLGCQAGNPSLCGANYINQTGGRLNSLNFTAGGAYVITNDLVATARIGHYFLNNRLGTYGIGTKLVPRVFCDTIIPVPGQPLTWPSNFGCRGGDGNNEGVAGIFRYDENIRDQFDVDGTYSFGLFGRHELKGGFQNNETQNNVDEEQNDSVNLKWGTNAPALTPTSWLTFSTGVLLPPAAGARGYGKLTSYAVKSDSRGINRALYVQDQWRFNNRLTLNLGLRGEQESVPAVTEGGPSINFSWGSKLAPRLGAAYDLTGDGKTKITGFYGLFYDRFKLTMSRRTFGGEKYHNLYFDLFATDRLSTFNSRESITGGAPFVVGGSCSPNTAAIPGYGRVRCDIDTSSATGLTPIDPDLKAFQQREITFTLQRELSRNYLLSTRYTRKQVIHAVEDIAFPTDDSAVCCNDYITGNPGEGEAKRRADVFGFIAPKAERQYDALELRLDRRFANNYFFSANYTLSRLYGNYSGTASSDEEGRLEPNIERYFDSPGSGFNAAGGSDSGRMATDRPHVFKTFGTYSLSWDRLGMSKANSTDFQLFFTASSGSVLTSFVQIDDVEQVVLYKRGDLGRTPLFTQTDLAVRHTIKFGRDGRYNLKLDADIINLFNEYALQSTGRSDEAPLYQLGNMISSRNFTVLDPNLGLITAAERAACAAAGSYTSCWGTAYRKLQTEGAPAILTALEPGGSVARNRFYNIPMSYQTKRTVRYGIRFLF